MATTGEAENPLEQLGRLTGGLAHEIRNPLSTLRVNLQLLAEDLGSLAEANDHIRRSVLRIKTMQNEVTRLSEILDDFVRFVAKHQLDLRLTDLNDLIRQIIEFCEPQAAGRKVVIRQQLHPEPLRCQLDRNLFEQALLNLFLNAQDAMPEGGDLIIRTDRTDKQARVEIIDTGVGIRPEHLPQVFDAYFSTKRGGTGLGLATTRRIVEEHAGRITVHSEPGKGSSFTICLPLAEDTSPGGAQT